MGEFTSYIDLTQILLYIFWFFFAYLLFHLQRETRREGYPLETDETGELVNHGVIYMPDPKTFVLPHGRGTVEAPSGKRETRKLALEPMEVWDGAPKQPTGNPMLDGVGPASYAERADVPDLTHHGEPRIVPTRADKQFSAHPRDLNPIGLEMRCCDRQVGGVVSDIWVDRSEHIIRYYEVTVGNGKGAKKVLVPMGFVVVRKGNDPHLYVHAVTSAQLAEAPKTKHSEQVTLLEEDKIMGYFGGGLLYATRMRAEPLL